MSSIKNCLIGISTLAMTIAGSAPAYAGSSSAVSVSFGSSYGHHVGYSRHRHHYYGGHSAYRSGYHGGRHHRGYRHKRHHGLSGGEAALIAAGIIGGVILIDRAIENSERRHDGYYDRGYASGRSYPYYRNSGYRNESAHARDRDWERLEHERRRLEADRRRLDDEWERLERQTGAARPYEDNYDETFEQEDIQRRAREGAQQSAPAPIPQGDDLDKQLLGGPEAKLIRTGYSACADEARQAAMAGRLMAAMPADPSEVKELDNGVYLIRARFTVQEQFGDQHRKVLECEVDHVGVRFLKII